MTPGNGAMTPGNRSSFYEGQNQYNGHGSVRQRQHRSQTDLLHYGQNGQGGYNNYGGQHTGGHGYNGRQSVYPLPHKDRSYETVTSAAASGGSADPAGYHTDPTSSDNSSIERRSPAKRQEPVNDYGIGFTQSQYSHNGNLSVGLPQSNPHPLPAPPQQHQQQQQFPRRLPAVPRKEVGSTLVRRQTAQPRQEAPQPEKRKSWLTRKFSKNRE